MQATDFMCMLQATEFMCELQATEFMCELQATKFMCAVGLQTLCVCVCMRIYVVHMRVYIQFPQTVIHSASPRVECSEKWRTCQTPTPLMTVGRKEGGG